jgi:hypothetical protein
MPKESNKTEEYFKKALLEAVKWESQLTEYERTKISFAEARQCVVDRILKKYKDKILKEQ